MYSRIKTSRLYEQIVEQIEKLILDGKLHPGDQLPPERELAEQFSVSRTAVREAVKALREKGLVEIQTGRGTFITHGTQQVFRNSLGWVIKGQGNRLDDLVQVREILEPPIAAMAAEMAAETDIQNLRQAVEAMDEALDDQDADTFIEADLEFHLSLANATQNRLVPTLLDSIVELLREQRKRIFLVAGGPERGQYHHKRILEAVTRHDASAAHEAMEAHLAQIRADSEASHSIQP